MGLQSAAPSQSSALTLLDKVQGGATATILLTRLQVLRNLRRSTRPRRPSFRYVAALSIDLGANSR